MVQKQSERAGTGERPGSGTSRNQTGVRNEEDIRSTTGIRNSVESGLQEAGKSRVQWGHSRKSAQLLREPTQLTSWLKEWVLQVLGAPRELPVGPELPGLVT